MGRLVFLICIVLTSSAATASTVYIYTQTVDGKTVDYVPITKEEMAVSHQSVAYTVYNNEGAFIYYDKELFKKLKRLSKFLIIEHERAHHYLGHTLSTKAYRERKDSIPPRLTYRKEVDADCESGYRAHEVYGSRLTSLELNNAMRAIYLAEGGDFNKHPEWLTRRTSKVITCFEGLIDRPEVLEEGI
jgi:hypothetical protein